MASSLESNLESKSKKRLRREELRAVILQASIDWVSLEAIAKAVGRNSHYLLNEVIPSMLEDGLMERMFPETPRNPYQKYKKK